MNNNVRENDVIQLLENAQEGWVACLMIVSEVRAWGVLAYLKLPLQGDAYLRVPYDQFEIVGRALLVHPDYAENEGETNE